MLAQLFPAKNSNLLERITIVAQSVIDERRFDFTSYNWRACRLPKTLKLTITLSFNTISSILHRTDFALEMSTAVIIKLAGSRVSACQRHGPCPSNRRGTKVAAVKD
jgi:hypothetical protein